MAVFRKRTAWENELARRLSQANRQIFGELMDEIGAEPDVNNLKPDFWDNAAKTLSAVAQTVLAGAMSDYLTQLLDGGQVAFDPSVINQRAAEWARTYSYELVRGINNNTKAALQQIVAGFYTDNRTLADLRASISPLFGPVRAEAIAITETTRAVAKGEQVYASELNKLGLQTRSVVQTANDERVCPICGPNDGKPVDEVGHPPFHVRCRCGENTEVVQVEATA
jgi:hypothetical protein